MRVWRLARRIVIYGALLVLVLVLGVVVLLSTPWFEHYARDFIVRQSRGLINGELAIGGLSGNFVTGVVMENVAVQQGGMPAVRIRRLVVHYSPTQVARGNAILIDRLELYGLSLSVFHLPSGGLNLGSFIKKRPPSNRPRRTIEIREIRLDDAELTFDGQWGPSWMRLPQRITRLTSTLGLESREGWLAFPIKALRAEGADPDFSVHSFSGLVAFESSGWSIRDGVLQSGQSALSVSASFKTTGYDVTADASTYSFPEMAGIVPGLKSIDVPARVQLTMAGPQNKLKTHLVARSPAGDVTSDLVLDSTVPGWTGKGRAEIARFDISRWLPTDVESDLTGTADFDLLLGLGHYFPRGRFSFSGPRVLYAGYEARNFRTTGTLIVDRVVVDSANGVAYGSPFRASGWIDIPEPYGFHLAGQTTRLDLRQLPKSVPVPRMRSSLTFDYDATGRFHKPVLVGEATFAESTFLDIEIAPGSRGTIDTRGERIAYSANGNARNLDIGQIGEEFDLATLREPQFAGKVEGDFDLAGAGSSIDDLTIDVKGTRVGAVLFGGQIGDGDLDLQIRNDTLSGSGRGQFKNIDSAILLDDPRAAGTVTGRFDMKGSFPGLFGAGFDSTVSVVSGSLSLADSRLKNFDIQSATIAGEFDRGLATLTTGDVKTAIGTVSGKGRLAISRGESDFTYVIDIADASQLKEFLPVSAKGRGTFRGRAIGPLEQTRVDGTFTASDLDIGGVAASSASGNYHLQGSPSHLADLTISGDGSATFVSAFGRNVGNASAKLQYNHERLEGDLEVRLPDSRLARISGNVLVHPEHNELHISALRIELANERWVLSANAGSPIVSWSEAKLSASDLVFDTGTGAPGRIAITGELGRAAAAGSVVIKIEDVPLQDLRPIVPAIAGYTGRLNATVTIDGTLSHPGVAAEGRIDAGAIRGFSFESLHGTGRWTGDAIAGDLRLDQSPGVWLTANGSVPLDVFSTTASSKEINLSVRSSTIQLALLEGLTPAVRNMVGTAQLNMTVNGQANDPRFDGFVNVENASFEIPATGVRYRNGNAHITFTPDAVRIETLHLEDSRGNPLDLTGTAGTHALHLGELGFEVSATQFQALRNDLGDLVLNGVFTVTGTLAAPIVSGDVAIERASLDAGTLLLRFQRPYAVTAPNPEATELSESDTTNGEQSSPPLPGTSGIWDNLTLRLRLLTTNNLLIRGENMHLSREAVASIGDINVVFGGDLSIRKAPQGRLDVSGALQTVRGSYSFQGRRFTIERDGTLRFFGNKADPLISITATRTVSGVVVRVALRGQASAPELELTSTPTLDESDILSLLLFGQPVNELAGAQRNELALQAATLAGGFVVSPAVSAVGERLGLDFLQLEPVGTAGAGSFRLSAGREIWKGLFLTYAREFSQDPFDELLAEYELSQYLRLRAGGSDASARARNSLFRRVERFGIDLIFFFSY